MAKKKEEAPVNPKISDFIGKKLTDASRENGETVLHFSNGYKVKVSGSVVLGVVQ